MYKLLIFDVDGTLADRDSGELLPGVAEFFQIAQQWPDEAHYAIASNQGGVGLRYWMETKNFGDITNFPTERETRERIESIVNKIGRPFDVHLSFAYQSKRTGVWGPTPDETPEWSPENRKPKPGMILAAMKAAGIAETEQPLLVLMVGDSEEDELAAAAVGVEFIHADTFFERGRRQ